MYVISNSFAKERLALNEHIIMKKTIVLSALFLIVFGFTMSAQQSGAYDNEMSQFQRAFQLYESGQYDASISLFNRVHESASNTFLKADAEFFIASASVRTQQKNAEQLMDNFISNYPTHPRRNSAYFDVAQFYFRNKKTAYALKWFEKVDEQELSSDQKKQLYFQRGYCYFVGKKYEKAQSDLLRAARSSEYEEDAKYYLGYMAYEGDDYDKASLYFDQLQDSNEQASSLNYYQADKNYKAGEFQKAIDFAQQGLKQSVPEDLSQLSKIIGESYFNLKQYDKALPYLKDYKGVQGKWEHDDFYQLGYVYFKQKKYELAISEFNRILDGNDAVSQNAYHHLAQCYLALNKRPEALTAFKNASELDFDQEIKADASLQYAKLSYEIGNPFQSVPDILNHYLSQYPNSNQKNEIESMLVNAYVTSKNYQAAYDLMQSSKKAVDQETYQAVAYNLAVDAYQEEDFKKAKDFFERTKDNNARSILGLRATYWLGELALSRGDFDAAITMFKNVKLIKDFGDTPESHNIDYSLGYAYFSKGDYKNAAVAFEATFTGLFDPVKRKDAVLRLADSEFAQSEFRKALYSYIQAQATSDYNNDYAAYQQAVCLGLLNYSKERMELLQNFSKNFPKSTWRDDALLLMANDLAKSGKINQAIAAYNQLLSDIPNSPLRSKADLRKGLLFYNLGQNDNALKTLKPVALNLSSPEESRQALTTIEQIYVDMGEVTAYSAWLKKSNLTGFDNAQFDDLSFDSAQKRYIEKDQNGAVRLLEKYLIDFPNGSHTFQSHVFLSELYQEKNDLLKAIPHLNYILDQPANERTEMALVQIADAYLVLGKSSDAIAPLKRLANNHPEAKNQSFAHSNLMQIYFEAKDYSTARTEAALLLDNQELEVDLKSKALVIKGRSEIALSQLVEAKKTFALLHSVAVSQVHLAEALYFEAFFLNMDKQYQTSNERLQDLVKNYPSFTEISARGLLLMAQNFMALDDDYQANYILNHLINNFKSYPDLISEAQELLDNLKSDAAETNASITTDHE